MTISELLSIAGIALAVLAGLSVLIGNVYYVIRTKNNKLQAEQITQLQKDNETCTNNYNNLKAEFHELKGQVTTLRDVPLKEIRDSNVSLAKNVEELLEANKSVAKTNGKILDTLKSSAITLKQDTADAKTAVRTVKTDLAEA